MHRRFPGSPPLELNTYFHLKESFMHDGSSANVREAKAEAKAGESDRYSVSSV